MNLISTSIQDGTILKPEESPIVTAPVLGFYLVLPGVRRIHGNPRLCCETPVGVENRTSSGRIESQHAFACQCRWNVEGTVEHWGHIHERTNQFAAMFLVEPISLTGDNSDSAAQHWKLTNMTILDSQRLYFETRVRSLTPN